MNAANKKAQVANYLGFLVWWPGAESNCRHADFQSAALPTELPGREGYCSTFATQFYLNGQKAEPKMSMPWNQMVLLKGQVASHIQF